MSESSSPRSPRDVDDSASEGSVEYETQDQARAMANLERQAFLARRDVAFDVPDEVWLQERRCLLMLLEARMLLRELVEYKVKMMRVASGNLTISEIQNLLALYSENDDDADFISGTYLPSYCLPFSPIMHAIEGPFTLLLAFAQDLAKLAGYRPCTPPASILAPKYR